MAITKRAILYARLSITTDESVSIERQLEAGRLYAEARGWTVVAEYVDDGVSASANSPEQRRGWQQVLAHERGTFDVVLVWKVDRLARRVLDFLNADKALQQLGAAVAAVEDPVDMSTAQGRAFATMLAVFAELEAEGIAARVRAAREALIKTGRVAGGAAPFGYWNQPITDDHGKPVGGKILAKEPKTISYLVEAAARVLRGESVRSVTNYLNEEAPRDGRKNNADWTVTVTKRTLANPVLAGMTPHNPGNKGKRRGSEVLRDSSGMPIIREDIAILSIEEYNSLLKALEPAPYVGRSESYLSGLVWCGHCETKMFRNAKNLRGKKIRVFQCPKCAQQVSHLEDIVEKRFLETQGKMLFKRIVATPSDYDTTEIDNQINVAVEKMRDEDADVIALAERIKSLKELRKRSPEPTFTLVESTERVADEWAKDKRATLLSYYAGVQLVKGRVGRKFDQERLSFVPAPKADPSVLERAVTALRASKN